MRILCIHGAPGVGKLSVGRQIQANFNAVLLHDHLAIDAATAIFPFGSEKFSKLRSRLFSDILDAALSTRQMIVVTHADDIFWIPSFGELVKQATAKDYKVSHALLTCNEEEHERRIGSPERSRYYKITAIERLATLVSAGEFKPFPVSSADIVLDTTFLSPRATAIQLGAWIDNTWGDEAGDQSLEAIREHHR